jgi:ABC-2 type transport system ATP-binding protein
MLQINNFSKSYQDHLVLSIDALTISPGVNWLKGENGSGKTSLFKSLAGIVPFDGEISLGSVNLKKEPIAFRKLVNYSEAEPLFPEFLTAKDIVRFIGKTKGASSDQQDNYCRRLGIDQYFTKSCGTFSSGMLKKLSLATAFFGDPKLIILDEPLVTLDEGARETLMGIIHEKLTDSEITFLLSSHQSMDSTSLPLRNVYHIHNKTIER